MLTRARMLGALALAACGRDISIPRSGAIRAALSAPESRGPDGVITMRRLVKAPWIELYVFGPYSSSGYIARCIGAGAHRYSTKDIDARDDIDLLLFRFADGSVVSRAVQRGSPEFSPDVFGGVYASGAAFTVQRSANDGATQLVPVTGPTRRCAFR